MYSVALLNGSTKRMDTPCQLQQHGLIGEWRDKRRRLFSEVLIMDKRKRIDAYFDNHFGLGVRWGSFAYQLEISVALPFVTIIIGLGKDIS